MLTFCLPSGAEVKKGAYTFTLPIYRHGWSRDNRAFLIRIARQAVIYMLLCKVSVPDVRYFNGPPLLWQCADIRRRSCNNIEL
jgi:hypothetical protein